MENASENIDGLEPVAAGAEGVEPAAVVPAAVPQTVSAKRQRRTKAPAADETDEQRRREMQASFNNRISHLCKLAALVIAVVAFATIALGQEITRFVLMGLCLSVALLAIAMLQDHYQHKQ